MWTIPAPPTVQPASFVLPGGNISKLPDTRWRSRSPFLIRMHGARPSGLSDDDTGEFATFRAEKTTRSKKSARSVAVMFVYAPHCVVSVAGSFGCCEAYTGKFQSSTETPSAHLVPARCESRGRTAYIRVQTYQVASGTCIERHEPHHAPNVSPGRRRSASRSRYGEKTRRPWKRSVPSPDRAFLSPRSDRRVMRSIASVSTAKMGMKPDKWQRMYGA